MFEELTATRQVVRFAVEEPLTLPGYPGSTFRGALGFAFKKTACALRRNTCESCLVRERCAYSVCFETPVPEHAAIMRKYPFAPHPFVLEPATNGRRAWAPGETLDLGLVLVGRGNDYLAQFIYAFEEMALQGLGRDRAKLRLVGVRAADEDAPVYDHAGETFHGAPAPVGHDEVTARAGALRGHPLRIVFETPARVKFRGQLCTEPTMSALMPNVLRRLSTLSYFHCGGPEGIDAKPVLAAGDAVEVLDRDTTWHDWSRFSGRQKAEMTLGGFTGTMTIAPPPDDVLTALLWGETVHIGKASAFGLGKYRVEAA
jgi:hypothetical protein